MPAAPSPPRAKLMSPAQVAQMFDALAQHIVPHTELQWQTPLDLLVAVVLSAQCTDVAVNKATAHFFPRCRTVDDYLALGEAGLAAAIRSIGLYQTKARHLIATCQLLRDEYGGQVPATREDLMRLPGVGRKSANVILNVVFGQPTLAVDTHIFRVANRIGLVRAKTADATELALLKRVPAQHLLHAHHYLVLHGRHTCVARQPLCGTCPVAAWCNYPAKTARA